MFHLYIFILFIEGPRPRYDRILNSTTARSARVKANARLRRAGRAASLRLKKLYFDFKMFNISYLLFSFFSINLFLMFTPAFQFVQFNWYLIWVSILSLLLIINQPGPDGVAFGGILNLDTHGLLISSILTLFYIGFLYSLFGPQGPKFRILPLLLLIIYFGFTTFTISNDLIVLYLSIELFSLTFYLITTIHQNYYTTEAGIKYFIYNFLAGAFYLLGCALIYSELCTINFVHLAELGLTSPGSPGAPFAGLGAANLGWLFILISFLFKLSIAPFHFWTPDVYQGVLYPITAFFTIFPKFIIATFFLRLHVCLLSSIIYSDHLLIFCGLLSIFIGAMGALNQYNIKRLFAYSTILNSGFLIILIGIGSPVSYKVAIFYILTYIIANLGLFTMLTNLNTTNLINLSNKLPALTAALLSLPVLSLAGLPPFVGFIAKFLTIYVILGKGLTFLAIFILTFSAVSLFYYLRFVHYALFYNRPEEKQATTLEINKNTSYIVATTNLLLLGLSMNPSIILLISSIFSNLTTGP